MSSSNTEFFEALELLQKEKGIPKEYMLEKIKSAIVAAVKRDRGITGENLVADFDEGKQTIRFAVVKTVVEEVTNPALEITLDEAKKIKKKATLDDVVELELETKNFGRIAAKIGKNVIVQAINEAINSSIVQEFEGKQHEILSGVVTRVDPRTGLAILEVGRHEIALPTREQMPDEKLKEGDRIKIYVVEVKKREKEKSGHEVVISRTHPGFVRRLFELEVPEIADGTVEIVSVAREAGARTKISVFSKEEEVDAIGACIGPKKARISNILAELKTEKIDIIKYSEDPAKHIACALSPATVLKVEIDEASKACRVIVNDDQLSLAIGREGQNARLAAKLTGWKIDIKPLSQS